MYDIDGQISGFVGVQRDISQQKELDRLKDEFVSNVSHELRTPIANVKLYISLLTRGKPEKYEDYLQTLRREAARLEKLIEDLLDLSRLDLGTTPVMLDAHRCGPAGGAAHHRSDGVGRQPQSADRLSSRRPAAFRAGRSGHVGPSRLQPVDERHQLHAGRRLDHRDHRPAATATIRTGSPSRCKIPAPAFRRKDLPHLFERFYRGEAGRKSGAPGTGLGLAISAQIMNKLGGLITVDSQPGEGASFTVWLKPA